MLPLPESVIIAASSVSESTAAMTARANAAVRRGLLEASSVQTPSSKTKKKKASKSKTKANKKGAVKAKEGEGGARPVTGADCKLSQFRADGRILSQWFAGVSQNIAVCCLEILLNGMCLKKNQSRFDKKLP